MRLSIHSSSARFQWTSFMGLPVLFHATTPCYKRAASLKTKQTIHSSYSTISGHSQRVTVPKPPLCVMPLGGSIAMGVGSSDGNGYRKALVETLRSDYSIGIHMVGSRRTGSMANNDHEGWRGFRIDEIEKKGEKSVRELQPDILTVNAGSNDCLQNFRIESAADRMEKMLECLWTASPRSVVVLSTLLVNVDREIDARVLHINNQFRALVRRKETEQKRRIVLADMYASEGPDIGDLVDGTHPGDVGYVKMARIWARSIQEVVLRGLPV
ncbi:hypothetical protein AAE478_006590 [Parahypoxylon ruwenzoriense]